MYRNPKWKIYLCEYVMSIMLEDKLDTKRFYLKTVMYQCDDPEQAYSKAIEGVPAFLYRYKNKEGDIVKVECHAIKDIQLLSDTWDGIIEQADDSSGYDLNDNFIVTEESLESIVTEKSKLSIFLDEVPSSIYSN